MDTSSVFQMDPAELETEANGFKDDMERFDEIINSMKNRVARLSDSWKGAANNAFSDEFAELELKFSETADIIGQIGEQLQSIKEATLQNEANIAAQITAK